MQKSSLISVIMPVYNGEKYLKEAIESVLHQTYTNFEFIILNDGSTDMTEEIILSYDDPRIVYVKNISNLQIVKTLNKGIDLAKGTYIARMDADDISLPERFEQQIIFLEQYPHVDALFSTIVSIDSEGKEMEVSWHADKAHTSRQQIVNALPFFNVLAHPTLMIKTKVLKQFYYEECAKYSEDYNLWLKLISSGFTIEKLTNPLLLYRIVDSSLTQKSNQLKYGGYKKNILAKYCLLRYKAFNGMFNHFDRKVFKSVFKDMGNMIKTFLKEPLRTLCIKTGRLFWHMYPKKYQNLDILFIFKSADMGGAERVQLEVLKVANTYKSLTLLTHRNRDGHFFKKYKKYTEVKNISFISNMIFGRWMAAGYFQKVIEHSQIKLVFGSLSGLLYDIVPTVRKGDTKFIDLFHALDHNIEYYSFASVKGLDRRIVIDSNTESKLKELYRKKGLNDVLYADRVQLIENSVYVPSEYSVNEKTTDFTVLFVGRDAPVKRVFLIREIAKKLKHIKFILAGVEADPNDPDNLEAIGKVTETASLYSQAHVLLLLSKREGFPMVIMEAMAYGTVPVCTNVGGLSRHIVDGENGFLLADEKENNIIDKGVEILQKLSHNKNMMQTMSETSYRYAKIHFNEQRFSRQYKELFKMYIERR